MNGQTKHYESYNEPAMQDAGAVDANLADADLVRAAVAGSKEAFGAIYSRYAERIHDYLFWIMRDRDRAADVLQDSFLTAGARLHQLADPQKLRPWLYAVARHEAFRVLKKATREVGLEKASMIPSGADPSEEASKKETAALVRDAVDSLPPRDRTVFDLHFRHGLDGQELADAAGITTGNAYVIVNRLKSKIERSLGALLVSRLGREDCPQLRKILSGWDGRFDARLRKRVASHVEGCDVCSDTRKRVLTPQAMLGLLPLAPMPEANAAELLEKVELVSAKGEFWPQELGGFPPPGQERRIVPRAWLGAAAAVLVLVLAGGGPALEKLNQSAADREASQSTGPASSGPGADEVAPPQPEPSAAPALLLLEPVPEDPAGAAPEEAPGITPGGRSGGEPKKGIPPVTNPPAPAPDTSPSAGEGSDRASDPGPSESDDLGPSLGRLILQARAIRASSRCSATVPATTMASVTATDPSGVASVRLQWSGAASGSRQMTRSDPGYVTSIGPFELTDLAPGESATLNLTVVAEDEKGNLSSTAGSLILTCPSARASAR